MYPENGTSPIDSPESPFQDPQSTSVPHLHRHQPTTENHDDPTTATGLRQRSTMSRPISPGGSSSSSMRIHVQTPLSDLGESGANGRRKELVVDRKMKVEELKDGLATGRWGDDGWLRDGMRLVWRGRIVRDDELLGEVVTGVEESVHTFHLVARRSESSPIPQPRVQVSATQETAPISDAQTTSLPLSAPSNRATTALHDSLHYLFFLARHNLCRLLDAPPLAWHDTVPPPAVEQAIAHQAVISVIRGIVQPRLSREEGWEGWEGLFDDAESLVATARETKEAEIKTLWSSRLGRAWRDGDDGEDVAVELDGITYTLHLPPLHHLSEEHLAHLTLYLRITTLIPLLVPIIEHESRTSAVTSAIPSVTRVIRARGRQPQDARVLLRLRIPTIPMPVLIHMGYSAIKIAGMLWMLTRGMKWDDMRFWIMAGAAAGWWVADGYGAWVRARPRMVPQEGLDALARQVQAAGGAAQHRGGPVDPRGIFAQGRNRAGQAAPLTFATATAAVPLLHLPTDSAQLGNPSATGTGHGTTTPVRRTPPWIQTQLLLPFLLWFITLIPEWETIRARSIRQRERAMRVVVGQATTAATVGLEEGEGDEADRPNVYPEGLNAVAKRYYERVMARGEGVDWEEEREAQRAMGIPEEENGDRMRML